MGAVCSSETQISIKIHVALLPKRPTNTDIFPAVRTSNLKFYVNSMLSSGPRKFKYLIYDPTEAHPHKNMKLAFIQRRLSLAPHSKQSTKTESKDKVPRRTFGAMAEEITRRGKSHN
jgi:hypothetical protein